MKAMESRKKVIQVKDENEWKKLIKDQEASKLSRSDYCRINQINYHSFDYWSRKLRKKSISPLIPITIKSEYKNPIESSNKILSTLTFNNGNVLHIYDQETLLMILSKVL
jgi:hypothetical protein